MLQAKDGAGAVITVAPSTNVRMALSTITAHDIGQLPVMSDDQCVGSLAESDLMAKVIEDPRILDDAVESHMDAPYPVVEAHVDADQITALLQRGNAACLVRENGSISGIVTRYDVVRALTGAIF